MRLLQSLALIYLLVLPLSGSAKIKMQTFKSPEGKFSILGPAQFQKNSQSIPTKVGNIELVTYTASDSKSGTAFIVGYSDYPAELVKLSNPQKLLESAKTGQVSKTKGKLVSEKQISIQGYPGIEVQIVSEMGVTLHGRLYMIENRLYQILSAVPTSQKLDNEITQYLESFQLTK